MSAAPWAWAVFLLNAALVLAAAAVAAYLLRSRDGDDPSDVEAWHEGARDLAGEVRRAASSVDRPADRDRISRRLLPLSGRIQGHVRAAPGSVEAAAYRGLFELGVACQRVALEHRPIGTSLDGVFLEDRLEALADEAAALEALARDGGHSNPREKRENAR